MEWNSRKNPENPFAGIRTPESVDEWPHRPAVSKVSRPLFLSCSGLPDPRQITVSPPSSRSGRQDSEEPRLEFEDNWSDGVIALPGEESQHQTGRGKRMEEILDLPTSSLEASDFLDHSGLEHPEHHTN